MISSRSSERRRVKGCDVYLMPMPSFTLCASVEICRVFYAKSQWGWNESLECFVGMHWNKQWKDANRITVLAWEILFSQVTSCIGGRPPEGSFIISGQGFNAVAAVVVVVATVTVIHGILCHLCFHDESIYPEFKIKE